MREDEPLVELNGNRCPSGETDYGAIVAAEWRPKTSGKSLTERRGNCTLGPCNDQFIYSFILGLILRNAMGTYWFSFDTALATSNVRELIVNHRRRAVTAAFEYRKCLFYSARRLALCSYQTTVLCT